MDYIVIANFKMNGSVASAIEYGNELFQKYLEHNPLNVQVVLAAPYIHIPYLQSRLVGINLNYATQNMSSLGQNGAYTGDISARMVKDLGANYSIIGHSERRQYYLENNQIISQKIELAHQENVIPILCIGENLTEYQNNLTLDVIETQLDECLPNNVYDQKIIIAYEPVWSIGTGKVAQPQDVAKVANMIADYSQKRNLKIRLVYGGSVNQDNVLALLTIDNIHGFLVGGACLKIETFWPIIKICENSKNATSGVLK